MQTQKGYTVHMGCLPYVRARVLNKFERGCKLSVRLAGVGLRRLAGIMQARDGSQKTA